MTGHIEMDTSASENILEVWYGYDEKSRLANVVYTSYYYASSNTYRFAQNYEYSYNDIGQLSSLVINHIGESSLDSYYITPAYDSFDRYTSKEVKITDSTGSTNRVKVKEEYTYLVNGSALVSKYVSKINDSVVDTYKLVQLSVVQIDIEGVCDAPVAVRNKVVVCFQSILESVPPFSLHA